MQCKQISRHALFFIGLLTTLFLVMTLAGCAVQKNEEQGDSSEKPQAAPISDSAAKRENSAKEENPSLDTANLNATVVQLQENGIITRPTITSDVAGGQVSEQSLDDDGTEIMVVYTPSTVFQIAEINRATYEVRYSKTTRDEVKKESSIYSWGTYSGTNLEADRIVVVRYVEE